MLKNREKFWAFIILVGAILALGGVSTLLGAEITRGTGSAEINETQQAILTAKLRILELIAVGMIGIAGAAGQALFRTSENADAMNDILKTTIDGLKHSRPVNLLPANDTADSEVPQDAAQGAEQAADAAQGVADQLSEQVQTTGTDGLGNPVHSPWNNK